MNSGAGGALSARCRRRPWRAATGSAPAPPGSDRSCSASRARGAASCRPWRARRRCPWSSRPRRAGRRPCRCRRRSARARRRSRASSATGRSWRRRSRRSARCRAPRWCRSPRRSPGGRGRRRAGRGPAPALMPNATPGFGRATIWKSPSRRVAMSCGGTPPIAATCPDCRLPVRTLASGMILKTILSRWASPLVGPVGRRPRVAGALDEHDLRRRGVRVQRERPGADEVAGGPVLERHRQAWPHRRCPCPTSPRPGGTRRSAT